MAKYNPERPYTFSPYYEKLDDMDNNDLMKLEKRDLVKLIRDCDFETDHWINESKYNENWLYSSKKSGGIMAELFNKALKLADRLAVLSRELFDTSDINKVTKEKRLDLFFRLDQLDDNVMFLKSLKNLLFEEHRFFTDIDWPNDVDLDDEKEMAKAVRNAKAARSAVRSMAQSSTLRKQGEFNEDPTE